MSRELDGHLLHERYALQAVLGEGGTARVYRAWDTRVDRGVAIKRVHPALSRSKSLRRRMEVEARALELLDHPRVVRLYELVLTADHAFLVMELVEGGSLAAWVGHHGPMPLRLAVTAIIDVCEGVEAAHARGIVHRDLKPQNVLVGVDDRCKVADFGIARLLADETSLTRTGLTMGTTGFMAPEQLADAKRVDERADVYSIGASLYSLLTGVVPRSLPEALGRNQAGLPELIAWPLTRATMPDPRHRYPTVARLRRVLVRLLDEVEPLSPDTPGLHTEVEVEDFVPSGPTFVPE